MYVSSIKLENFRNIRSTELSLSRGMNVFYGDNGQGKTNLLEGVSLFALGRSFRGARDLELIRGGEAGAEAGTGVKDDAASSGGGDLAKGLCDVTSNGGEAGAEAGTGNKDDAASIGIVGGAKGLHDAALNGGGGLAKALYDAQPRVGVGARLAVEVLRAPSAASAEQSESSATRSGARHGTRLEIAYTPQGRRICRKNGVCIRSLSEFVGNLRVVLFASPQLAIVRDSAAMRRRFLDEAIAQLKPVYMERLSRMNRILLQRNKLLRQLAASDRGAGYSALRATLEPWTLQFAAESTFISAARLRYVERILGETAAVVRDMSGGADILSLAYPDPLEPNALFERLMSDLDRELHAGTTLHGAHREDMAITLCGRDARVFASQGQQRSAALALKLAEGMLSETITHDMPVYLLDDVLSELDDSRRRYVLENIAGRQVLLTVCDNNVSGDMLVRVTGGQFFCEFERSVE